MSLARQKHQPIALADILVDENRFTPESESDSSPSLDRMLIHVDMPDSRYWSTHRPDTLTGTCSGDSSSTAAYPDVVPFSSVSSFNFPATADNTLLTPISNAGSPPLQQRPSTKGNMRAHHQSHPSSNAQQPTPPNTSTGVYYPAYDLSSSSQSSSPLTVQPQSADYTMTPYLRQSPNHMHGHPSPKDDVPPPSSSTYFGSYTVSDNSNSYADFNPSFDPSYITQGPGAGMSGVQVPPYGAAATPILEQPDPRHYRMHPQPGHIEDIPRRDFMTMGNPGQLNYSSPGRRVNQRVNKRPARDKRPTNRPVAGERLRALDHASRDDEPEPLGNGEEAVTLSDKCEEEARFIFETRKSLVESGMKGKGMWEEISRKYEEVYGQRLEKATLQMRLTRTFAKHAIWPEKELERLKEAYQYIEEKRYRLILTRMREIGGGQCWNWTPQLIEAKLIDLGFEEANIEEKTKLRKRRRQARTRRAVTAQQGQAILHGGEHTWPNGLGLHPAVMQAQAQAQGPMHHHHEGSEDPEDTMPDYTEQQRDHYLNEVLVKSEQEETSSEPDTMDVSYHASEDSRDASHPQARVAKQAVEQLLLNSLRM